MLGINNERMYEFNRALFLFNLFKFKQATVSEIANSMELSIPAVSRITKELIHENKIEMFNLNSNSRGRKAGLIKFVQDDDLIICLDVRPNSIHSVLSNLFGEVLQKEIIHKVEFYNKDILLDTLIEVIKEYQNKNKNAKFRCAIAMHGQVDSVNGISLMMPQLKWHEPIYVKYILEKKLNIPVLVDNDCVMRCLAQKWHLLRTGIEHRDFCTLNLDYGIGSSFIINNEIYRGSLFGSGQIGHTIIDPYGRKCSCGRNGCLETEASIKAIKLLVNESLISIGEVDSKHYLTFDDIIKKYLEQDRVVKSLINRTAKRIGIAIYNMLNVLNINHIYLYGRTCLLGDDFLKIIQNEVLFNPFDSQQQVKRIATSIEYGSLTNSEQLAGISFLFGELLYKTQ